MKGYELLSFWGLKLKVMMAGLLDCGLHWMV